MSKRAAAFLAAASLCRITQAAGPLGEDGAPIRTSQYAVDPTAGPILAGTRVTGLAGAYVAIAEGVDGNVQTPAAPGVRPAYSVDHFDYDLGLGLTVPTTLTSTDYFNTGRGTTELEIPKQEGFVFVTPALNLQFGKLGLGLTLELQNYAITSDGRDLPEGTRVDELGARLAVAHLQAAYMLFDETLIAGVGLRASALSVENQNAAPEERELFTTSGAGVEVGLLWAPHRERFRIGAAFRSEVTTKADPASRVPASPSGDRIVGDPSLGNAFWLPERVTQPWDLNVGVAFQVGPRPLNVRWIDPDDRVERVERRQEAILTARSAPRQRAAQTDAARDAAAAEDQHERALQELQVSRVEAETRQALRRRYRNRPRSYLLVSMSLVVTGAVDEAVGIEGFLQRRVSRSGQYVTLSPRLGLETEVVPHWVKLRAGTYGEPSRFQTGTDRIHGTFGFDVKLFPWTVFGAFEDDTEWRLGAAVDGAVRYFGWGVSVGVWH